MKVENNMIKKLCVLLLIVVMLIASCVEIFASDAGVGEIAPCFTNMSNCSFSFGVIDPGEAHISMTYVAREDVFLQAYLKVEIQKKHLLFFWKTVDIDEYDDVWEGVCNDVYGTFYEVFPVDGKGTYRAVYTFKLFGTNDTDIIEDTQECVYD